MPNSLQDFREQLYSHKLTLHELRLWLQKLSTADRADALLSAFTDRITPESFSRQEVAGRLLIALLPESRQSVADILRSAAKTWNASVEQLPLYLGKVFGQDEVIAEATRPENEFTKGSREAQALRTVRWWLGERNT
jgi:hypothetical protein